MSQTFAERIKARMAERVNALGGHAKQAVKRVKTRQNIEHNRFDAKMWRKARENEQIDSDINDLLIGDLHDDSEDRREGFDNAPELVQDLFHSLYKPNPQLVPKRAVEKDARLNRKILESMKQSPHWEDLRDKTVLDDTLTTMALTTITETVREIIAREQAAVRQSNKDKAESGADMNNSGLLPPGFPGLPGGPGGQGQSQGPGQGPASPNLNDEDDEDEEGDGAESGEGDGDGDGEDDAGDAPNSITDDDDDYDDDPDLDGEEHEGEDYDDVDSGDIDRMIQRAMDEANKDLNDLEETRKGIGLGDAEWKLMSPEDRIAMAERLNTPQIKAAAEMFGQMKRMALGAQATKIVDVPHEAYDVTTGNEIRDALGSEFALLDDEDTEVEFYRRFLESELLIYKKRGTEDAGKGPIIVCIDKSGSMQGWGSTTAPFTWAMGVAEALRRICQDQERDYYAMFFGNNNDRHRFDFPNGAGEFNKVLEFLSVVANGGTQFDGVLEEAIARVAADYEKGKPKADIVFITDGQAHLTEDWLNRFKEEKERVGCRVFGIFVSGASDMSYYGSQATQVLDAFSDVTIPISDLTASSVKDVFAQV